MLHASGCNVLLLPVWIAATFAMFVAPEPATAEATEGGRVEVVRNMPGACGQHEDSRSGSLALFIQPPAGRTMKLTYSPNEGWRFDRAAGATTEVAARSQPGPETQADQPMTVFIDGPTG